MGGAALGQALQWCAVAEAWGSRGVKTISRGLAGRLEDSSVGSRIHWHDRMMTREGLILTLPALSATLLLVGKSRAEGGAILEKS